MHGWIEEETLGTTRLGKLGHSPSQLRVNILYPYTEIRLGQSAV